MNAPAEDPGAGELGGSAPGPTRGAPPVVGPESPGLELTHVEHALALVAALALAYAGGLSAFFLVLDSSKLHPVGILFGSFRHAGIFGLAAVGANIAYRRMGWPVALVPAVALGFLVRFLSVIGDWIASRSPVLVDEGSSYYASHQLGEVLWRHFRDLLGPGAHFDYGAVALGLVLAARCRGRWVEGIALRGPTTIYLLAIALPRVLVHYSRGDWELARVLNVVTSLVLIAVLLPLCERVVRRAFLALGVRAPDE